jgi:hypothetical protein
MLGYRAECWRFRDLKRLNGMLWQEDEVVAKKPLHAKINGFQNPSLARGEHWSLAPLHFFFEDEAEVERLSRERDFVSRNSS